MRFPTKIKHEMCHKVTALDLTTNKVNFICCLKNGIFHFKKLIFQLEWKRKSSS